MANMNVRIQNAKGALKSVGLRRNSPVQSILEEDQVETIVKRKEKTERILNL